MLPCDCAGRRMSLQKRLSHRGTPLPMLSALLIAFNHWIFGTHGAHGSIEVSISYTMSWIVGSAWQCCTQWPWRCTMDSRRSIPRRMWRHYCLNCWSSQRLGFFCFLLLGFDPLSISFPKQVSNRWCLSGRMTNNEQLYKNKVVLLFAYIILFGRKGASLQDFLI